MNVNSKQLKIIRSKQQFTKKKAHNLDPFEACMTVIMTELFQQQQNKNKNPLKNTPPNSSK